MVVLFLFATGYDLQIPTTKDSVDPSPQYTDSEVFEKFVSELKIEARQNGEEFDLNDDEARELFSLMQEEFSDWDTVDEEVDVNFSDSDGEFLTRSNEEGKDNVENLDLSEAKIEELVQSLQKEQAESNDEFVTASKEQGTDNDENLDLSEAKIEELFQSLQKEQAESNDEFLTTPKEREIETDDNIDHSEAKIEELLNEDANKRSNKTLVGLDPAQISKIEDLQTVLPGMPLGRLKKILNSYEETLGHPSMLTLVPMLRETMPDFVSSGWLKRSNKQNADFALQKASEDGVVDSSLLNSMLEVKANSGSLNDALEYHEKQFAEFKIVSTNVLLVATLKITFVNIKHQNSFCHPILLRNRLDPFRIQRPIASSNACSQQTAYEGIRIQGKG